ncbi:TetR/AcrR family transcriptional regulator [Nocardia vinacea]|uniref:TetR/AcrR family transcriptional regulator n=1 Tax=Nocardia vinacea TaxID=96468 RepID=A0ABZ1YM75_9NOCA|nr:helix-turn-helix domain-containing protein [Nocardia vinacea]
MASLTSTQASPRRGGRGARQRILNAAAELFYNEGINATGVELISAKASVSKRTLYQHFPSKAALVEEYLRMLRQAAGNLADAPPEGSDANPRARLLALFDSPNAADSLMRGCPFHNAAVEAAEAMPGVQDIVHAHKRNYIDGLTELARQAGAADPQLLGNQLAVLYEGAAALSTSLNDPAPWAHARATAEVLITEAARNVA